jgi:hypothetical protein
MQSGGNETVALLRMSPCTDKGTVALFSAFILSHAFTKAWLQIVKTNAHRQGSGIAPEVQTDHLVEYFCHFKRMSADRAANIKSSRGLALKANYKKNVTTLKLWRGGGYL